MTKNEAAWEKLFVKYKILEKVRRKGFFIITAKQINEIQREARLMTKFDHSVNLPNLFSENKLAILPITRGSYIISKFEAYKILEQSGDEIIKVSLPQYIESIDYNNLTSESMALNCAYVSSILSDFLEDKQLVPTVSGRMSSGTFSFYLRNTEINSKMKIDVKNSQIEIDGGFEGEKKLAIIEAKLFISEDFLIRQLYYPFRLWSEKVSKKIVPVFMIYSNGVFNLYEYEFEDPENYNSLVLVKQKNYSLEAVEITLADIINVMKKIKYIEEPKVPFPQADNFKRIINLCEILSKGDMTKDEITLNYAFTERQTKYYTDAARYLGLINKSVKNHEITFSLNPEGYKILHLDYKQRQLKLVEAILKHKTFGETFKLYLRYRNIPSKKEIVNIMKEAKLYNISSFSTFDRRASTVRGWIKWILDLQKGQITQW